MVGGVRLLGLDVDGTLCDPSKQVTPGVRAALSRAHEAGLEVAICSGRHPFNVDALTADLGLPQTAVCLSGAFAELEGREVYRHALDGALIARVLDAVEACECYCSLSGSDFNLTAGSIDREPNAMAPWTRRYKAFDTYDELRDAARAHEGEVLKMAIHGQDDTSYERVRELLARVEGIQVARSDTRWVDVTAPGCTKAIGIEKLASAMGVSLGKVAVVGDDENDVEAIGLVGLGIAMGNAIPEVKAVAKATVADNAHDGCAEAIDLAIAHM